ncbi:putative tryptophan halogenase [Oceanicola granulosus HTCC2516]|uniref:Putative tryptophan halogenase n=1 Tax=Oceanicola granulosus (strain ATCC BAA-861 / DSM 15982 / KCTC 12143 / HTCC2516) TaxID=314256 RepID=Q2CG82_OCEGH|nr:tryptophan halogenase family protein [Oceanicola granulosus]EAR51647.1 putative tryptophan halogenase [Oceanicola granulosus HTCC2516]
MRVVILGGGTAGWMAAAALSRYFGDRLSVTLVESDAIGTVGVGEATIPQLRLFHEGLGIDEADFLRATGGTIKLGIEFIGWQREGTRYFHGFGDVGRKIALAPFHQYWLRYNAEGGELPLEAFSVNAEAARRGLYGVRPGAAAARLPASAYHFDATRYAAFLRRFAEAHGVVRREGRVRAPELTASGDIAALVLESGARLSGDLFLDCSGFRALLIEEALGAGWEDWSHWLPCDRALAVASAGDGRLDPFTRASARAAGWQWRIPLQHRTGNGHVYASAFTTDDAAHDALMTTLPGEAQGESRPLRFTTGRRRAFWRRNCIALGLASGFLEPLESTSIYLVQSGIARLLALFPPPGGDATALRAQYNRQMAFDFALTRDFLILHYHLTERPGALWEHCRTMALPDSLAEKIALFAERGEIVRFNGELFDVPSWLQVMWGQGLRPARHHPLVDAARPADLARYIDDTARDVAARLAPLDSHAAFIARRAAAPAPAL